MPRQDNHQIDVLQPRGAATLGRALRKPSAALGLALLAISAVACPSAEDEAAGAGSFAGDADLIGTWDVTIEFEGDIIDCSADISAGLGFDISCTEEHEPWQYNAGCDVTLERVRISGSVSAGTGSIQIHDVERYEGPQCESYGLSVGQGVELAQGEGELTRVEAGVGSLGGRWTSEYYDWSCVDDDCSARARESAPELNCDFELSSSGRIVAACTEAFESDEECVLTMSVDGSIGGGELHLTLTESFAGADCGDDDLGTIDAVRR